MVIMKSRTNNTSLKDITKNNTLDDSGEHVNPSITEPTAYYNTDKEQIINNYTPKNIIEFTNTDNEESTTTQDMENAIKTMNFEGIQLNLLQLGRIQNGDKLWIDEQNMIINIDNRSFSYVRRYIYGNGRNKELQFIKVLIDTAIGFCTKIANNYKSYNRQLQTLLGELQGAKNGLCKLKITYINDNLFQSQIDAITTKIDNNASDCRLPESVQYN